MKIVVLAGGTSSERDVSIVTGSMVCKALKKSGHKAILVDVFLGYNSIEDDISREFEKEQNIDELSANLKEISLRIPELLLKREENKEGFFGKYVLELCKAADIVFMGLHGSNGEDGKVQAAFDLLGIRYTGTGHLSSGISMNKNLTKVILISKNIPMPEGFFLSKEEDYEKQDMKYPCIVKPCCGGSSVGVSIVNNKEEYEMALKAAFEWEDSVVVEQYIKGREFSIGVIEGRALPIIEIAPLTGFYDYKNKYNAGMTKETCPAVLSDEITRTMQLYAQQACREVELETYGRVDFLMDEAENIYCLEINTLPGMTPTSLLPQEAEAAGMSYEALCDYIIRVSMKKYQ